MRASEPVVGVTPVTQPARTAALCAVAIVSFLCGCLALLWFVRLYPVSEPVYGAFSQPARIAVLAGQIVVPSLGGPLLGVALGRWVRARERPPELSARADTELRDLDQAAIRGASSPM
jgi:hypothetical protein